MAEQQKQQKQAQEQDINQLLKVRREKLKELQLSLIHIFHTPFSTKQPQ